MEDFCTRVRALQQGHRELEEELVQENLPLCRAIAKRYLHCGLEEEDLLQLAALGLLKALRRFDTERGLCFSTYAVPLIAGEIKCHLRDNGPIHYAREIKALGNRAEKLRQQQGDMSLKQLAEKLHASPEDVAASLMSRESPLSLNAPVEEEGASLEELLPQQEDGCEEKALRKVLLEGLLLTLSPVEKQILYLRFFQELPQREVGQRLSLSQVQISRLEKRALKALREKAEGSVK